MRTAMPVISSGMPANATPLKEGGNILTGEAARTNDFSNSILALLSQMPGVQNSQLKDAQNASADLSQTNLLDLLQQMMVQGNLPSQPGEKNSQNAPADLSQTNLLDLLQQMGLRGNFPSQPGEKNGQNASADLSQTNLLDLLQQMMVQGNLPSQQQKDGVNNRIASQNALQWLQDLQDSQYDLPALQANKLEEWKKYLTPVFGLSIGAFHPLGTKMVNHPVADGKLLSIADAKGFGQDRLIVSPPPLPDLTLGSSLLSSQNASPNIALFADTMNGSAMHGFLAHGQDANSSLNAYPLAFLQSNVPVTLMTMTKLASKAELSNKAIAPLEGTAAGSLLNYGSLTQIPMPYGHVANNPSSTLPPAHFPFVAMPMTPPALSQGLSERIQWMEKVGLSSMRLNLNPPQLGNLQVVVTVNDANQGAHVQFLASTPQMVQTLTNHFSDLRDQLATFGFNNMSFDVGYHQNGDSQREPQKLPPSSQRYQLADDDASSVIARIMPARNGRVDDYA